MASRHKKAKMIGIYGIPGSGKTHLQKQLQTVLYSEPFQFYEGSDEIASLTPGGLQVFKNLPVAEKTRLREHALSLIEGRCKKTNNIGVVTGHFMFWENTQEEKGERVDTETDWSTYTHIIYLNINPSMVVNQRRGDVRRKRPDTPVEHLRKWQEEEMKQLRDICWRRGILFTAITGGTGMSNTLLNKATQLLQDFCVHNEEYNTIRARRELDHALPKHNQLQTMLLLDADKTLGPPDTGEMFWKINDTKRRYGDSPLKKLFQAQGYSYNSFRQAALLYDELDDNFSSLCDEFAANTVIYPEMINLLKRVAEEEHVGALVVTCGVRWVWEKVLAREGLGHVSVIGGGRVSDEFVVTGGIKGDIVDQLHAKQLRVFAFGDSPLDMAMLQKADKGLVVVGEEGERSSTMDKALAEAIDAGTRHSLYQVCLPETTIPRLDTARLPVINLGDGEIDSIVKRRIRFMHATHKNGAKILMSPMRDANISGHDLRKAHERVGFYLATEFLGELLGTEAFPTKHVQGHTMDGYRFRNEKETLIVPLMCGEEPMAFGISKALKLASFAHAKSSENILSKPALLGNKRTIILVDSVVNTGNSIIEFIQPLRKHYPDVHIVIVAGVVQAESVHKGDFAEMLKGDSRLSLVALRVSENKFKGQGGTDTGHRLFNTTYLD